MTESPAGTPKTHHIKVLFILVEMDGQIDEQTHGEGRQEEDRVKENCKMIPRSIMSCAAKLMETTAALVESAF